MVFAAIASVMLVLVTAVMIAKSYDTDKSSAAD